MMTINITERDGYLIIRALEAFRDNLVRLTADAGTPEGKAHYAQRQEDVEKLIASITAAL